ncbi:MAG: hypothetical protein C4533_05520 [Candidatus Omnitrophota bacterium]|jgi:hypothetical protein|nr:MAG: hypothetical protein C4533_05520 [Candidatus Omnitrophota bacterium]
MNKNILIVSIKHRNRTAGLFQKSLTKWGCLIKTRIGIHDAVLDKCSDRGLIILELVGKKQDALKMYSEIRKIKDLKVKLVSIS